MWTVAAFSATKRERRRCAPCSRIRLGPCPELTSSALLNESTAHLPAGEARSMPPPRGQRPLGVSAWRIGLARAHLERPDVDAVPSATMQNSTACCELTRPTIGPLPEAFCVSVQLPGLLGQHATPSLTLEAVTADKRLPTMTFAMRHRARRQASLWSRRCARFWARTALFMCASGAGVQTSPAPQSAPSTGPARMQGMDRVGGPRVPTSGPWSCGCFSSSWIRTVTSRRAAAGQEQTRR